MKNRNYIVYIIVLFTSFSFGCGLEEVVNEEGNYKDGLENGEFSYFGFGNRGNYSKLKSENFKDGKLNGESIYYFDSGEINSIGNYEDGKQVGNYKFYDKNGKIYWKGEYKKGDLIHGEFIKSKDSFKLF